MLKSLLELFNKHPNSIHETYWQHAKYAMSMAIRLLWTGLNLACHAVFPFLRMSYARDQVLDIADTLLERNPTSVSISTSIFNDISETIHHTPMIRLQNFSSEPYVNVYAKCEMFLPSLSTKDRIVIGIIRELERSGELKKGGTIIEASSGNTGCAVAMLAACFGYRAIISVPAKTSIEKISMMKAYGATVIISPPDASKSSPEHYVNKAKLIKDETPNSVLLNQYENPVNPNIHYQHTAAEIWGALNGNIDCVIVCSSSGGTISGIGRYLKEKKSTIEIVMPDPVGSIYHDYFNNKREDQSCYRPYKIEGIGKDYICGNIDFSVIDNVVQVTDEDAFNSAKYLAREEGILAGGSSGAALYVANVYAKKFQEKKQKANIVVVLPDSGFKYLSTFYNANE